MPTFFLFVVVRFLSGVFSGFFAFLATGLIRELQEERSKKLSNASLAFLYSVTPVAGACYGGWIGYDFNWSFIFYTQIPFLLLTLFILARSRKTLETLPPMQSIPFDTTGFVFYLLSICPFMAAVCLGQLLDWQRSSLIVSLFGVSVVSLIFFILWELKQEHPFIDIRLFKIPIFSMCIVSIVILFATYFGTINLLSLWLHLDVNYTPIWIALSMLQMLFAGVVLFIFIVKWMEKTHIFLPVFFSVISFAISSFYSSLFTVDINFGRIAISRVFAGFGVAFFFFPLLNLCLDCVPKGKEYQAGTTFHIFRLIASALGISAYDTLWIRRKIFYHERLGSYLTPFSEKTKNFFSDLSFFHEKGAAGNELLEAALLKQSTALALADCFYLMGWLLAALFLVLFIFYLRQSKKKEKSSPSPSA